MELNNDKEIREDFNTEKKSFTEKAFNEIMKELKVKGVKLESSVLDDEPELSIELLSELMETPVPFEINDDGELVVVINGEEIILDPKSDSTISY